MIYSCPQREMKQAARLGCTSQLRASLKVQKMYPINIAIVSDRTNISRTCGSYYVMDGRTKFMPIVQLLVFLAALPSGLTVAPACRIITKAGKSNCTTWTDLFATYSCVWTQAHVYTSA
jgi:hypothetical protein